jgi:hypothetical protein
MLIYPSFGGTFCLCILAFDNFFGWHTVPALELLQCGYRQYLYLRTSLMCFGKGNAIPWFEKDHRKAAVY